MPDKEDRAFRMLWMYEMLSKGGLIEKSKLLERFGVSEKTVRRDIDDLRTYLVDSRQIDTNAAILYDKAKNAYELVRFDREWLTNEETLALCKILLESRALVKEELETVIEKLLRQTEPEKQSFVKDMIKNELFYYVSLRHGKRLLPSIWKLSEMIHEREITEFSYTKIDGSKGGRRVKPVAIMFSEFYFYLIAYFADDRYDFPTVFRVDRIEDIRASGEKFHVPYDKKFSDGEFRKRVQFMHPGEFQTVTFKFKDGSIEAVLDRLPTAEIIGRSDDGTYTVTAEVFGKGIDMWLRSQGDFVKEVRSRKMNRSRSA
ncbi:WYL domain-containing protein [Synergistales bacterium]|nr:WYL domain-containing protein [Synergistales bacterium]